MSDVKVLRGAWLFADLAGGPVDIVFRGEEIVALTIAGESDIELGADVIDVSGLLVLPGLIDAHVHPIHDETGASVGRAAVAGGVTTTGLHLYPGASESFEDAVHRMEHEASQGTSDFGNHVRLTPDRVGDDLSSLVELGALSVKVFLAHPDKSVQASLGDLTRAMGRCAPLKLPVIVHAELGDVIDALPAEIGLDLTKLTLEGLAQWRSPAIEATATEAAATIAAATGATLYLPHVSCAEALTSAVSHRQRGTRLFVETCPHYLFLTASDADQLGGLGRVLPPLRSAEDVRALRLAVECGEVDVVASDHCGHGPAAKRSDDVAGSKAGLPGVQQIAPLMIDAALAGKWLSPAAAVRVLAERPAEIFGLSRKGRILPGYDADLTLVDPSGETNISAATSLDASSYSPYEGKKLRGSIHSVWRRGEQVFLDGELLIASGGRLVKRRMGSEL